MNTVKARVNESVDSILSACRVLRERADDVTAEAADVLHEMDLGLWEFLEDEGLEP
jgi:hypothetical protein